MLRAAIIDPDFENVAKAKTSLHMMDNCLDVICWRSALDALACQSAKPLDLLILELWLPDVHGLWLLGELRRRGRLHDQSQILVCTSLSSRFFAQRCLRAGATGFICKNKGIELFDTAIRSLLSGASVYPDSGWLCRRPELGKVEWLSNLAVFILHGWHLGHSLEDMATRLGVPHRDLCRHSYDILETFGVDTMDQVFTAAVRLGIHATRPNRIRRK